MKCPCGLARADGYGPTSEYRRSIGCGDERNPVALVCSGGPVCMQVFVSPSFTRAKLAVYTDTSSLKFDRSKAHII